MAHPKVTKVINGVIWHLEDTVKSEIAAKVLVGHLRKTEDKKATYNKTPKGFQVWWTRS